MFGSKDKPEHPQQDPERSNDGKGGKKGLFVGRRRKTVEPSAPVPAAEPPAPSAEPVAAQPEPTAAAPAQQPAAQPEPAAPVESHDQAARQDASELFSRLCQAADDPPAVE